MALSHILSLGCTAGSTGISKTVTLTAGSEVNIDESVAASTTDLGIAMTLDVSQVKSFFMVSDKDLTVETNSAGTPVNTFTLTADKPFIWFLGNGTFRDSAGTAVSTDITGLFVTNAGLDAAALQIRCLVDPTI